MIKTELPIGVVYSPFWFGTFDLYQSDLDKYPRSGPDVLNLGPGKNMDQ